MAGSKNTPAGTPNVPDNQQQKTATEDFVKQSVEKLSKDMSEKLEPMREAIEKIRTAEQSGKSGGSGSGNPSKSNPRSEGKNGTRSLNSEDDEIFDQRSRGWRGFLQTGGATVGVGTSLAIAGGKVAEWPLIGKIPYATEFATWLQSAVQNLTTSLGLGTGTATSGPWMSTLPNVVGTTTATVLGIPSALFLLGALKGLVLGKKYGGFWNHAYEAAITPVRVPFVAYELAMRGRKNLWSATKGTANTLIGRPAAWLWGKTKDIAGPIVKPTGFGVLGAGAGAFIAMNAGGPITPALLAGYGIMNFLKNKGYLGGENSSLR